MRQFTALFAFLLGISVLVSECSQDAVFSEGVKAGPSITPKRELTKRAFFGDQKNVNQIINIDLGGLARQGADGAKVPDSLSIAIPPSPSGNSGVSGAGDDYDDYDMGPPGKRGKWGKKGFKKWAKRRWWKKTTFNNFNSFK